MTQKATHSQFGDVITLALLADAIDDGDYGKKVLKGFWFDGTKIIFKPMVGAAVLEENHYRRVQAMALMGGAVGFAIDPRVKTMSNGIELLTACAKMQEMRCRSLDIGLIEDYTQDVRADKVMKLIGDWDGKKITNLREVEIDGKRAHHIIFLGNGKAMAIVGRKLFVAFTDAKGHLPTDASGWSDTGKVTEGNVAFASHANPDNGAVTLTLEDEESYQVVETRHLTPATKQTVTVTPIMRSEGMSGLFIGKPTAGPSDKLALLEKGTRNIVEYRSNDRRLGKVAASYLQTAAA